MAQPILKTVPLSELRISKLNMRHSRKKPDVSDILPSIREAGIRQTLLVRKEGDHYGVVAGRRRYFALKEIEKINKILAELDDYERDVLYPLATEQVEIELDDGVKANYPKFGDALKKIPGLS
mgnify:CR=1 FL=1